MKRLLGARWRAFNLSVLRVFLRLAPSENQRVFALTLIAGALCGLAAVSFHLSIIGIERLLITRAMLAPGHSWIWWTIITPLAGGILAGVLLQYVVPGARGSGIPQVKVAYGVKGGKLPITDSLGKFLLSAIQIGSGASLGREGPTVQICGGIASFMGRAAALSQPNLRRLMPVGAAAAIAAAFNAPISAVTFTIEEVVGDLDQTVLSGVVVAAAISAAIERSILGEHPVFTVPQAYGLAHASSLIFYVVLGILATPVSLAFNESLLGLRQWFQRLIWFPAWARPGIGGFATGVIAVVGLLWLKTGGITGGGYDTVSVALAGQLTLKVMLALCVMKLIATVLSYSSGGAGGIFAPALFIGAMLGGSLGFFDVALLHHSRDEIGAFALVGMGAVFAGIVRAPMTSVLIIFEMTGSYGLILPLMIANMTAYGLCRRLRPIPIYDALLEQDGIHLSKRRGPAPHALEGLTVARAMTARVLTLPAGVSVREALDEIGDREFSTYPVIDNEGGLVGSVTETRLRRTMAEGKGELRVGQVSAEMITISGEQSLLHAALRMNNLKVRQLGVVGPENGIKLKGLLTMSDIVRTQAQAALESPGPDTSIVPDFTEVVDSLKQPAGKEEAKKMPEILEKELRQSEV